MILHLYNGRLQFDGPRTDVDGNETEDWGFEGPEIPGVKSIVWTYGNLAFLFESPRRTSTPSTLRAGRMLRSPTRCSCTLMPT